MSNTTPEGFANEGVGAHATDDGRSARDASLGFDGATPLTLCVDAATDARSVAVAHGARVVALVRGASAQGRASALLEEIDGALRAAGARLSEIDLYAVAAGPGSFTGIRTGLATIKAFASIHARPVAAVPTLHAVALSAGASARTLALIPAGRGEVFAQTLRVESEGRVIELDRASHVNPTQLLRNAAGLGGPMKLAGGGARAHAELIRALAAEAGAQFIEEDGAGAVSNSEGSAGDGGSTISVGRDSVGAVGACGAAVAGESVDGARAWLLARAVKDYGAEIARLGLISYREGRTVGAHELAASYVRPSDAELNERWHR